MELPTTKDFAGITLLAAKIGYTNRILRRKWQNRIGPCFAYAGDGAWRGIRGAEALAWV